MNIIMPEKNQDLLQRIIKPLSDENIAKLIPEVLRISRTDEAIDVYRRFYATKYKQTNLSSQELALQTHLQEMKAVHGDLIRTSKQGSEYEWIKINSVQEGEVAYRFYLAPNPENMHEIVRLLSDIFVARKIPVRFKYQLTTNLDKCDRIIIYSDSNHKTDIENAILDIYRNHPNLFTGSERGLSWVYESKIPNVYFAPETPGESYGIRFAETMIQAKQIINFLLGITTNNKVTIEEKKAYDYMQLIIGSLLLRNGLLLSKDELPIRMRDTIRTFYNYDTGILSNATSNVTGYTEAQFFPTLEGRNALLNNFYNITRVIPQPGLQVRHLTLEERRDEINRALYGDNYQPSSPKK